MVRNTVTKWMRAALALVVSGLLALNAAPASAARGSQAEQNPVPLLAYYYIWFDTFSWDRAKIDYPLIGRYSSDDPNVMRRHIQWARQSGIRGFIVSWKSTEKLNRRLEQLMKIAAAEDFKLAVIYQGLDVDRNPLPVDQVATDIQFFIDKYSADKVFDLFGRPLVIWSGTWKFSRDDVIQVTRTARQHLLILASERSLDGYQRLADVVDGNAYYWSSVNPDTFPGYQEKLSGMGSAVHAKGGLWIAPAAPGFDARQIGGTTVVDRKDGVTLRRELDVALKSSPDAVGLISWNEFSENSYIEPSVNFGTRYLQVLADVGAAPGPAIVDFDSSQADAIPIQPGADRLIAVGSVAALVIGGVAVIARRQFSKRRTG